MKLPCESIKSLALMCALSLFKFSNLQCNLFFKESYLSALSLQPNFINGWSGFIGSLYATTPRVPFLHFQLQNSCKIRTKKDEEKCKKGCEKSTWGVYYIISVKQNVPQIDKKPGDGH